MRVSTVVSVLTTILFSGSSYARLLRDAATAVLMAVLPSTVNRGGNPTLVCRTYARGFDMSAIQDQCRRLETDLQSYSTSVKGALHFLHPCFSHSPHHYPHQKRHKHPNRRRFRDRCRQGALICRRCTRPWISRARCGVGKLRRMAPWRRFGCLERYVSRFQR